MENINIIDKYEVTMKGLSFGRAFDYINDIAKRKVDHPNDWCVYGMRLPKWSSDVVIKVQYPDKYSKMTAPYLYVESRFGRVPWKETNIELFDNTWEIVKFEGTLNKPNSKASKSVNDIKNIIIKDIANANTVKNVKECSNQKEKSNCCNCNKVDVTKKQVKQVDHNSSTLDDIIDALILGNILF